MIYLYVYMKYASIPFSQSLDDIWQLLEGLYIQCCYVFPKRYKVICMPFIW